MIIVFPQLFARILKSYSGITIWPFIIVRHKPAESGARKFATLINHERIHARQQIEMLVLPFYLIYLYYYAAARIKGKKHFQAYSSIPFEREAYSQERDILYLKTRKWMAWRNFL